MRFFFSKQKTAYELRIRDWSSDVCSSDLIFLGRIERDAGAECQRTFAALRRQIKRDHVGDAAIDQPQHHAQANRPAAEHHDLVAGLHRSEEHTSELQSLMRISYAVFCLKKKKS